MRCGTDIVLGDGLAAIGGLFVIGPTVTRAGALTINCAGVPGGKIVERDGFAFADLMVPEVTVTSGTIRERIPLPRAFMGKEST
jgi:hypothetical protein